VKGAWFQYLLGLLATVLAIVYGASCALVWPADGNQVTLGHRLTGTAGWVATATHAVFFAWLALACFRRQRAAAWGVISYCVYLVYNVWVYSTGEGAALFPRTMQMVITNALLTGVLLAVCRVVLNRLETFDR